MFYYTVVNLFSVVFFVEAIRIRTEEGTRQCWANCLLFWR